MTWHVDDQDTRCMHIDALGTGAIGLKRAVSDQNWWKPTETASRTRVSESGM